MKLIVELGARSYPILIQPGCLADGSVWDEWVPHAEVVVVTNETVAPLYLQTLETVLAQPGRRVLSLVLPDGEVYKNQETLTSIYDFLLHHNLGRKTLLVALGGGVIGDMTGFAAATYQRGIDFIQVPTTLLSQVDSSVGGKTGINHPLGKNMIGAFKQPLAVLIDPDVLSTLPARELSAGLAEVIKYGLIGDTDFFAWLEQSMSALVDNNAAVISEAVYRSCVAKACIVAADETEQGVRATLNLGHTFGHAIEAQMGYGTWLHGEAVGTGMMLACMMSQRLGWLDAETVDRASKLIVRAGLPVDVPSAMTPDSFMRHMARDKKVESGQLRLVLLVGLGKAVVTGDFAMSALQQTLANACSRLA
jgi:3-dehydroquinate synthase